MRDFNFKFNTKILFGKNKLEEIIPEIKMVGSRLLLAYGGGSIKSIGLYDEIVALLNKHQIPFEELSGIRPNPGIESVREGVKICRENNLDFVLAVGGGSVLDCCKAIAAGVHYEGDPWDFMVQKAVVKKAVPLGTILTLAATGSEMNGNAVISNSETFEKRAMGAPILCPVFSLLNPEYTYTVNKWHTAAGITDIISHVLELYFTPEKSTQVQDAMSEALIKTTVSLSPVVLEQPENYEARAQIMWTSTLALNGLLSFGKLPGDWSTHLIEHEVSAIYDITHGAGLAIIFPAWMTYVLDEQNAWRFAKLARNVWGIIDTDDLSAAHKGIAAMKSFFSSIGMPVSLKEVDIDDSQLGTMAEKACRFGSIGLIKKLNKADIVEIFKIAL
ncbi:iron-containing alcohol dehydrogenase [Alkalitalea saponilacus]|uniref:Uncharacterized protein n=1 Tax=Alkalitalea saponilacus TaxID=889453 RepID=A0A1T5D770_9BACT|nr:iron-containing alcohol dehydrogenase [Alkalitalea saponilacus]ASB50605.1 NADH-dependent alcohol dehydrogenase [Alkalitalea saponilacus]SKB67544.1 hypothetical protein SAMN03080601_01009 [Alkalitalea saponilacus]